MEAASIFFRKCVYFSLFHYDTVRYVSVNCRILGIINRFIYASIVTYILGYVLFYKKGYQECDRVESSETTKVKGATLTNYSREEFQVPESYIPLYNRLWDVAEYVTPASENEVFFIMTNAVITPNQTFGVCDEDPRVKGALCGNDLPPCKPGYTYKFGNGVATGRCINSTNIPGTQVCEVKAWCPTEFDIFPLKGPKALLEDSQYYTVLIKNRIYFPKFGIKYLRSNMKETNDTDYLQSCTYDKKKHPYCPIFRIKDIVEGAGENFTEVAVKGAVISIRIIWNCNLDRNFMKHCNPEYSFHRLDDTNKKLTFGWNFRHSFHHEYGRRTLVKVYGIKFVLDVQGEGCKFAIIPTLNNIGVGCGLFALEYNVSFVCSIQTKEGVMMDFLNAKIPAPIISDCIMKTCLKSKAEIKSYKYKKLKGDMPFIVNQTEYSSMETMV